jgi:hypothetical protein
VGDPCEAGEDGLLTELAEKEGEEVTGFIIHTFGDATSIAPTSHQFIIINQT